MTKEIKFAIKTTIICTIITILSIPTMQGWGLALTLMIFSFPLAYLLHILPHTFEALLRDCNLLFLIPFCNVFIIAYLFAKIVNFLRGKL